MPTYRIRYQPELGRADETVLADRHAREGAHVVLYRTAWVIGRPREVVALRLVAAAVDDISASTAAADTSAEPRPARRPTS